MTAAPRLVTNRTRLAGILLALTIPVALWLLLREPGRREGGPAAGPVPSSPRPASPGGPAGAAASPRVPSSADSGAAPAHADDPAEQPATVLRGRVVDDRTGEPLAGAAIVRWREEGDALGALAGVQLGEARSGADGTFALDGSVEGEFHVVVVRREGYGTRILFVRDLSPRPVEVRLRPASALLGVVVGPAGEPLSGVSVAARIGGSRSPRVAEALSDERGRFRLEGLDPAAAAVVEVRREGMLGATRAARPRNHASEGRRLEVRLVPGNPFAGRVTSGGVPATGLRVVVPREDGPDLLLDTGADGRIAFRDSRLEVEVEAHPREGEPVDLGRLRSGEEAVLDLAAGPHGGAEGGGDTGEVEPDATPADGAEGPPAEARRAPWDYLVTLRVRLVDAVDGSPVALPVQVVAPDGRPCERTAEGEWRAPPESTVRVLPFPGFWHTGYLRAVSEVETGTEAAPADAVLRLERSPRVRLRVLRPDGSPPSPADEVRVVLPISGGLTKGLPPDSSGLVEVPVDPGPASAVEVRSREWPSLWVPVEAPPAAGEEEPREVRFSEPRAVRGIVRSPLGNAVPGAAVLVLPAGGREIAGRSGDDGTFLLERIPSGPCALLATAPGYRCSEALALDERSGTVEAPPLVLRDPARVEVLVLDAAGRPLSGLEVDAGEYPAARTGPDGRARVLVGGRRGTIEVRDRAGDLVGSAEVDLSGPEESLEAEFRTR